MSTTLGEGKIPQATVTRGRGSSVLRRWRPPPSPGPQRGDSHSEGLGRGPGKCSLPSRPPGGSGVGGGCPHAQHRSPTELKPGARQLHTQQRCSRGGRWPRPSPKFLCPAPTAAAWSTGWGLTWPESGVFPGTGCHLCSFCQHKVSGHVPGLVPGDGDPTRTQQCPNAHELPPHESRSK